MILIICLHTIKQFQVLLFSISNFIYEVFLSNINNFHTTVWFQTTNIENNKWLNSSIRPIDGTLIGTTVPGQSGSESEGNEGILHIPQTSRL